MSKWKKEINYKKEIKQREKECNSWKKKKRTVDEKEEKKN